MKNRTEVLQTEVLERLNDGGENLLRPFVRLFVLKASSYYDSIFCRDSDGLNLESVPRRRHFDSRMANAFCHKSSERV